MNFMINMTQQTATIDQQAIEKKFNEYIGEIEESKKTKITSFKDKIIETTLKVIELYESSKLGYNIQDVLDITLDEIFQVIQEEDQSLIHKFLDLYFNNDERGIEIENLKNEIKTLNKNNNNKDSNIKLLNDDLSKKNSNIESLRNDLNEKKLI
jgi:hypothetical protein